MMSLAIGWGMRSKGCVYKQSLCSSLQELSLFCNLSLTMIMEESGYLDTFFFALFMVWIIKRQSFDWKFPGVRKPWLLLLDVDGLCIQHSLIKTKYTTSTGILKYAPWSLGSIPFLSDVTESLREINEPSAHYAGTGGPEANCQSFSLLQQLCREKCSHPVVQVCTVDSGAGGR